MRKNVRTGEEGEERAMKKGIWGLVCLLALAAALMLSMGALAQGTSAGWNADGTVYTVVGKDGWWDNQQQVLLDHSCTVDLSQADTPDKNRYNNFYAPFKITGEKTEVTFVTGNR